YMFALYIAVTYSYFPFFFINDPAPTRIYTLSLHDALPISRRHGRRADGSSRGVLGAREAGGRRTRRDDPRRRVRRERPSRHRVRSEEHTSELQSQSNLVCRLLLEKKK